MKTNSLNRREFEYLFRRYFRPLTIYAHHFVCDIETAEDIVQDLFLYVYEKRSTLDVSIITQSYLYKSVYNRCLNNHAYHKIREDNKSKVIQAQDNSSTTPEDIIEQIEIENIILQGLELLSPKCRKIFEMSRFEGKRNQEIALNMGISKRTVESHINQALKIMRKKLKFFG